MKHGLWPSSPKEPQAAFEKNLMELVKYIFLECRTSLKSICQAIYWIMPSLSPVYVKDIYRLLVGENFGEYRYLSYMLDTFGGKNVQLDNVSQCPACPKKSGNMYVSLDALFGCVRKISAGTSVRPANHGETLFIEQTKVDSFLKNYKVTSSLKSQVSCHNFQAGSNLRSKVKTKKLDETAIFGAGCRHEVPLKFFSLKRGEEIGNAVYLLKWLKESTNNKNLNIYLYYDIACTLESHLKRTNQEALLENVKVAIPTFHCYGHKVSCQLLFCEFPAKKRGLRDLIRP
ncbi:uncharacterized protein LOC114535544 [Dendronephthya gigantea]|uniref:uncharacterized protein LOC114535544 n=1 Tax=Dendronephthya gigantea TaxID=151771 RepID=UPI00106D77D2|nr:uncharacterized protein LOC114535544 [Dendronephthya gigantea]